MSGFVDIIFGEILLERNFLEEAHDYLERGVWATEAVWYLGSLGGLVYLARGHQALGDISRAQDVIEEAARMALRSDSNQWNGALISSLAVRLALQRDDLAAAEQWWIKGEFPDLNTPIWLPPYVDVVVCSG